MNPKRILFIINTMDVGGAETFIMKVYRKIEKNQFQFDFLINKPGKNFYEEEIKSLGGSVHRGISKSLNPFLCFKTIFKVVRDYHYSCVFCVAVHPLTALDLIAAKIAGARLTLVRSTNSKAGGFISALLAMLCRPLVCAFASVMLAPSAEAGCWLFGTKAVKHGRVKFISNGVDLESYKFIEENRTTIRKKLKIDTDTFLVGHIGRFNHQKNHKLLLEIFYNIKKKVADSKLILVGDGELKSEVTQKVNELGLTDCVIFTGVRSDIPEIMMGLDVLLLPSIYEGMPNVVIEAQATGLPCVISDTITSEVGLTPLVYFVKLHANIDVWADTVIRVRNTNREDYQRFLFEKGYSIESTVENLIGVLNNS